MIHNDPSPLAGTAQTIKSNVKALAGKTIQIEDWYDRVHDKSWKGQNDDAEAGTYAWRAGSSGLPPNDEVLYGKIDGVNYLVNVHELDLPTS